MSDWTKDIVGKTLLKVVLHESHEVLDLIFDDVQIQLATEGDCCSHTWIESLTIVPDDLSLGGTKVISDYYDEDYIQVYQTKIHTNQGSINIEYRNASNGYYGGWLTEVGRA